MLKQRDCVKAQENASNQVVIGISLASDWLRKWHKCSGPIITLQFPHLVIGALTALFFINYFKEL